MIPFFDLKRQYATIRHDVERAVLDVLASCQYVLGPEVERFEAEFATYCAVPHAVACSSGTSALHLALLAAGVGAGDEVITVPYTFVATTAAIRYTGARPVYVDIDPDTLNIAVSAVESAITPRTKAILPVHLFGLPADMDALMEIAARHGLVVIEDAAQAHGAEYKGRRAGGLGHMACFSFYPTKNLAAAGEGGLVTTSDETYSAKMRLLRDWGAERRYHHTLKGFNYRMDAVQAAVLRVKLGHLDRWTAARREHAAAYDGALGRTGLLLPPAVPGHVYHVYAVRTPDREAVQRFLAGAGVQTNVYYPIPIHLLQAHADLGYRAGNFPTTEAASANALCLPVFPELTKAERDQVIAATRAAAGNR